jgi:hypothetical protein
MYLVILVTTYLIHKPPEYHNSKNYKGGLEAIPSDLEGSRLCRLLKRAYDERFTERTFGSIKTAVKIQIAVAESTVNRVSKPQR